jgi:sugar (pentulose or hexulose) kinase
MGRSEKVVLAVDAGSGGGRALVIDLGGRLLSSSVRKWEYETPADAGPMAKEFDPREFWRIICELVREAIAQANVSPSDIIAVSSASQREGVVFLDAEGRELYAGPNVDIRALIEGFAIDAECGEDVYRITGHGPSLLFTPARLKWFQANRPEVYERIDTVLTISDWIVYRLSGERVGEASCMSDSGLMDIHEVAWSAHLIDRLDLPSKVCPPVVTAGTRVGTVTETAAKGCGLAAGTTVVAGGADSQCGLLGMGVGGPGEVGIVAGWSGVVQIVTAEPVIDGKGRLWSGCHVLPGRWVLESNAHETGGAYSWLRDLLLGDVLDDQQAYLKMDAMAQDVPVGAEGVVAFIGPRLMDISRLKPLVGGFVFSITPSVASVEKKHLIRAGVENVCFALKGNLGQLEEVSGLQPSMVCVGGGLAQSDFLVQTLADVLARPIVAFQVRHVTSWGAAMCAAVGGGAYSDLPQAMSAMRPDSKHVAPDPERAGAYDACFERWLEVAGALDQL